MRFACDRQTLRRFDVDGRLHVADCRISAARVNPYYGREIPGCETLGLDPERIYQMYRDPVELAAAAPSFANLQLMMVHIPVNADEPAIELTVGVVGSDVRFEAPYLVASLAVWTAEAIALIETKAQAQLSSSYRYRPDMTPGVDPEGVAFDGVMRDIMGNHVALVEEGRAGPDVVVNDSIYTEAVPMKFPKFLAAIKSFLKPGTDPVAVDAAITAVMNDGKPRSTAFLRIASALKPLLAKDADFAALASDAAVEKEMEKAEDEKDEDDDKKAKDEAEAKKKADDEFAAAEKKKADDAAAGVTAGPTEGLVGAALDAALKAGKYVTAADAKALSDAAAMDAVTRINALHAARDEVAPLVGVVALDSAESVYRFALDHAKVDHKDVHVSALRELVKMAKANKATAKPATIAVDAAVAVAELPGLSRISRA